jgi:hypothetical protein
MQDANYFGTWANPFELRTVVFCEGDVTVTTCNSPTEFVEEIRRSAAWNEAGHGYAIDGMLNNRIIAEFTKLGLGDLLH